MKIVNDYPPNYDELVKSFPAIEINDVLITIGDTLYNPKNKELSDHFIAHEEVHSKQQLSYEDGVEACLKRYREDKEFRFQMEVEAYAVQCTFILKKYGQQRFKQALKHYAKALSGPIYGYLCSEPYAREEIRKRL